MAAATVFCMPSYWESTGLVYLEAALYGLPLVMLAGQGREHVFPSDMAIHLDEGSVDDLADALVDLGADGGRAAALGRAGRQRVLADHTLPRRGCSGRLVAAGERAPTADPEVGLLLSVAAAEAVTPLEAWAFMDFFAAIRIVGRRWYVVVAGLILTAAAAFTVMRSRSPPPTRPAAAPWSSVRLRHPSTVRWTRSH